MHPTVMSQEQIEALLTSLQEEFYAVKRGLATRPHDYVLNRREMILTGQILALGQVLGKSQP